MDVSLHTRAGGRLKSEPAPATAVQAFDSHDAVLLTIHSCGGSLDGREVVQNLVYFHALRMRGFSPRYTHHYYGAFSEEVMSALFDLVAFAFVNEIAHPRFYGGYAYEITEEGIKYAEKAAREYPRKSKQIAETVEAWKAFCGLKPDPLVYATKCHYILAGRGRRKCTADDAARAGKGANRGISAGDARAGVGLLKGLRLVK